MVKKEGNEPTSFVTAEDAAVVAFTKTFRSRPLHADSRHKKFTKNLPVELLLNIFNIVCDEMCFYEDEQWRSDNMSPSLFPYAIASVCSLWRDVISLLPDCWTHIVIPIDSPPIARSAIESQLSWSRDCNIHVLITRRNFDDSIDAQEEKAQVTSAMTIINSHIHHVTELRFNVMFSSSLPSFPNDFRGLTDQLHTLVLDCKEDDGNPTSTNDIPSSVSSTEPQDPRLWTLSIDGRNYYNICKTGVEVEHVLQHVDHLAISHYKPRPGESFSFRDFLLPMSTLPSLRSLQIVDVTLTFSSAYAALSQWQNHITKLELLDLQPTSWLLKIVGDNSETTLTRCAISNYVGRFPATRLTLQEIGADQDLIPILRCWDGVVLRFKGCPSFTDIVLDKLGMKRRNGNYVIAPDAFVLHIVDCPNFSVPALIRMAGDEYSPRFGRISVSGNVPSLSNEDRSWFKRNVPDFSWSS